MFIVLFVIVFILLDVIYSLRDISYWGMIPALSSDSHERTTYTALGAFAGSIGYNGLTVIVVPDRQLASAWKFTGQREQGQHRLGRRSPSSSPCSACSPRAPSRSAPRRAPRRAARQGRGQRRPHSPRSRPSPRTTSSCGSPCSYLLYAVANVATTGVLMYHVQVRPQQLRTAYSIAGVIPVITGLGTTAPATRCSTSRIPRRWLYTAGMALMIAGYTLFIIAPMNLPVVIVALVLFYLPAQTIQMTAILTLTDSIEYGQLKTGKRNEAVTLSVRPMLDKIAGALLQRHRRLRGRRRRHGRQRHRRRH